MQKNFSRHNVHEAASEIKVNQKGPPDPSKVFIHPAEAVLVPVMQTSLARSSLKRFWLQNWIGPSLFASSFFMHSTDWADSRDGSRLESNIIRFQHGYHSCSNSNDSSISSISSSSSDSDQKTSGAGDLDAEADSLTCRQSGLSSVDQLHSDSLKPGSKRVRSGVAESFNQAGNVINPSASDYGSIEVNNPSIIGGSNDPIGWGWDDDDDDDDRGMGMDIQALLSEFGDFGDLFEDDVLPFGEPPGTAESQALMFTTQECGDISSSPSTSMIDVPDPMLLPMAFPSLERYSSPTAPANMDDSQSKNQKLTKSITGPGEANCNLECVSGEFDHLIKAEALMTFPPEYGAVETPSVAISSSIFKSPYVPKSRKAETENSSLNSYVYSATPPSPCIDDSDEKSGATVNMRLCSGRQDRNGVPLSKKYYTQINGATEKLNQSSQTCNAGTAKHEPVALLPTFVFNSTNSLKSVHSRGIEDPLKAEGFLPSLKPILATEVECLMCQAFMCRIRHTVSSSSSPVPVGLSRLSGGINHPLVDISILSENLSGKSEVRKKESAPVRIAGDLDGGVLDGPLTAPVGVWRSVPKGAKSTTHSMELCPSIPHNNFVEDNILSYGLRQPLQELLDGLGLLVQQATSFVDVALDSDCGDGAHGWLAFQEQLRRGFSCGPSMVHAGCGGVLSSCHAVDIAGVELVDPLSVEVQPSFTISLLQSDVKAALRSAFGTLDGPLSVIDWCKGRSLSSEAGSTSDGFYAESTASASECRDSPNTLAFSVGEAISSSQSSVVGSFGIKDATRMDEMSERRSVQDSLLLESEQQTGSRLRPTLAVVPFPAILVGYQDDWLKTSANSLQHWEKAPLEPYATLKHMTYYVVCPDIEPLTTASADFFQQLGTVYETCKLGTHTPQNLGNEMDIDSGKSLSSGFVLIDCPQSMKIDSTSGSILGSISDYFLSLSNGWDLPSFLKSLSKVLKNLNLGSCMTTNMKEGNSSTFTVIYVVCPFLEPLAILRTVVEFSVAVGSSILSSDKERRSMMHKQVGKALNHSAAVDEALSNVFTISGFSIPKLVLQIVPVDAIFRVTNPPLNELVVLKEIAFTVYNKARRASRVTTGDMVPSTASLSGRSHSVLMQMGSPLPGMWKDCVGPRSSLQRESELDSSLRSGTWDSSWQARAGALGCDPNRGGDFFVQDEVRCMFEPLFILAEPGSLERGVSPVFGNLASESSKVLADDGSSGSLFQSSASSGSGDTGPSIQPDTSEADGFGSGNQKTLPSMHCCYGWTEDWRWMVCIWTDSRGELLDSYVYPFGGISSRQDTKGLQTLFVQILQQGCRILQACSPDAGKPRDFVISRIGCFFELESQEWVKALYSIGGSEVKKWSLQLRRSVPDGIPPSSNGASMQQQEMSLLQERTLPSSPSPLYSPHSKSSAFMKSGLGQPSSRKQLMGGVDSSRGLLQWVQSISFISLLVDHSLQLVFQADSISSGSSQSNGFPNQPSYLEGYTPVRSLGSASASYVLIPSPSIRFLPPAPLQLPTCLTAESPPLAHLLHSKGSAIPLCTGFVVSKAVPSMRKDSRSMSKEEWPSVLSVSLVDYYGSNNIAQERIVKSIGKLGGRGLSLEARHFELETHMILESVAAELHALSWMTVSPAYLERRSALPFHCDMVLRLRRLLHFADKELLQQPAQPQP